MTPRGPVGFARRAAWIIVLAGVVWLALWRRLQDPLSTTVIPAEDPFTHMALVRGHLLDGSLDALYDGGRLYPPGMHAIVAALWVYTGLPLESIFRFGPPVLGAIGVVGVALLLWRCHGPVAAVAGALALALAPEAVFRTTMMSPTAVDLAVLPFLLLAVVECLQGRLGWTAVVAAAAAFLVLSHPWLLAILAPVVFALVIGTFLLRRTRDAPSVLGAGLVLAVLGLSLLAAVSSCWSQCRLGGRMAPQDLIDKLALAGAAAALATATIAVVGRRRLAARPGRSLHWGWRVALAAAALAALYWGSLPAFRAGLPEHVNLPHMIGRLPLALAAAGIVAAVWTGNRAAVAGAALAAVTYPFVIYNPFDSPFWPHRTAVYLAVATAILAGIAVGTIAHAASAGLHKSLARVAPSRHAARWAPAAAVAVLVLGAGQVYADSPESYAWYRLYPECQHDALRQIAEDAPDEAIIIAGDWRPKLVMAAYAHDGRNVWFTTPFFANPDARNASLHDLARWADDVIVVVDPHTARGNPQWNLSFVHDAHFEPVQESCPTRDGRPRVAAYAFLPDKLHASWSDDAAAQRSPNGTNDANDGTGAHNGTGAYNGTGAEPGGVPGNTTADSGGAPENMTADPGEPADGRAAEGRPEAAAPRQAPGTSSASTSRPTPSTPQETPT